jgi:hypothetical protein
MGITEFARMMLGHFGGALEALQVAGQITEEENRDWSDRMAVALGMEPLGATPPGVIVARRLPGVPPPPPRRSPPPDPRFLRLVSAPVVVVEYHGGRLSITGVGFYDIEVTVEWRADPMPDPNRLFRAELEATDRDTEGLPSLDRTMIRHPLENKLMFDTLNDIAVADDVGTVYEKRGGHLSGGTSERVGRTSFSPGVPRHAARLKIDWVETVFNIDIPPPEGAAPLGE